MVGLKPPDAEVLVGLEVYKSKGEGIGGVLKQVAEDFVVEEVTAEGKVLELDADSSVEGLRGEFTHFTLQKKNWETMRAVKEVASRLRVSQRRLSFAGTKDKRAVTTQRVSSYNVSVEELGNVHIKDIILKDFQYADDSIGLGDLWGNRFTVTVRDIALDESGVRQRVESAAAELAAGFPNFFGVQRFGELRPITHLVGLEILRGNFEGAVLMYLTEVFDEEPEEDKVFRRNLVESKDFNEALKNVPKKLGYEAAMLNHLIQRPGDYIGALNSLPKSLKMMFVHAYQSFVFNKALSECIKKGLSVEKLPLVGFETGVDDITARILGEEKIRIEDFKIRGMLELSSRGEYRDCYKPLYDFKLVEVTKDELNEGKTKATVQFKLEKGCYATVVLREIMKN